MSKFVNFLNAITPAPLKTKRRWVILLLALISIFLITTRSCVRDHMHKKSLYVIGRDSTWYPLNVYNRERNITAFTNELIADIGSVSDLRFAWIETGANSLLSGLDEGNYDAVITSIRPDAFNQGKYLFSDPILNTGMVLVMPLNSHIKSAREIEGKTIGINTNSPLVFNAFKQVGANPLEINLINYSDTTRGLEAVVSGKIDGILIEAIPAYFLLDTVFKGKLHVVSNPLSDDGLRIVTLDNPMGEYLIEDVDNGIKKLKDDGTYTTLIHKWSLFDANKLPSN